MLSALFALLAGVVTVAAPCTLPVLPILLGASFAQRGKARPLAIAAGFIAAFAAVTVLFSLFARIAGLTPDALRTVAIVLIAVFGVILVVPGLSARIAVIASTVVSRFSARPARTGGILGAFLLGITLGIVWTPCAGPILGSILALLATQKEPAWAAMLLVFYAVGAAIPMLGIAYGGQYAATRVRALAPYAHCLQQGFGVIVVGFAAAMYFQVDTQVTAWLTQFYPSGQIGL